MRLSTATDGTRYLKNYGKNGTLYDADAFSSNHIYQDGVTQYTPLQLGNTLGAELVTNGTFDTDTNWTKGTGWTISGGQADANIGAYISLSQTPLTFTENNYYLVIFDVVSYTSGEVRFYLSSGAASLGTERTSIGTYYEIVKANLGNDTFVISSGATGFIGSIDNVSVKEITFTSLSNTYYNPTTKLFTKETAFTPIADSLGNVCHKQVNGFSHWVAWDTEPTTADIDAMNADHDLIGRVWTNSESLPSGLVAANMQHYYPGNEGSIDNDFVQDITIAYGSELVTNGTFDTDLSGWSYDVNEFRWDATTKSAEDYSSVLSIGMTQSITTTIGSIYKIKADFSSVSGGNPSIQMDASLIRQYSINKTVVGYFIATSTSHTLKIIGTAALFFVDNVSVKEVSVAEIQNYTSNCRTNFLNVSHGPSNLKFTQDATGRLTGYVGANLLAFNGDGRYCDTGWLPTSIDTYTLEIIMYYDNDGTSTRYIGSYPSHRIWIRENIHYLTETSRVSTSILSNGLYHLIITVDSGLPTKIYVNGVDDTTIGTWTSTSSFENFRIGKSTGSTSLTKNVGYSKVHPSVFTSTEVATAYAAAKTIYPTLP